MGTGAVKFVSLNDVIEEDWSEFLTIDLKVRASKCLSTGSYWHCPKGICQETLPLINKEFNFFHGLFPLKLFLCGPPASGKTHFADKLAASYGVPHIRITDLVELGYSLTDSFGDEIKQKAEEIKDQTIEQYNKTKKKKDPELDRNAIKVRLPDDIMRRLLALKLTSSGCKNKGFILDGYPRNSKDAEAVFLTKVDEEPQPTEEDPLNGY